MTSRWVRPGSTAGPSTPPGEAAASLALAPPGMSLLFDDIAVSQAIRMALSLPAPDALSTLTQGDTRYVGAVTVVRGEDTGRLNYDPFGVLFPAWRLQVGAGLFADMPAPAGPVIQRYGAGNPGPSTASGPEEPVSSRPIADYGCCPTAIRRRW